MDADTVKTAKPRRRWLRFSLRTLLIVVTVLAVPLGWVGWERQQVRRERATITWIEEMGGSVNGQSWFGLGRVWYVNLSNTQVSDLSPLAKLKNLKILGLINTQVNDLSPLAELKKLQALWLHNTQVTDLSPLAELKKLQELDLSNTQVSDEQVQELRQALPNCEIHHSIRIEK